MPTTGEFLLLDAFHPAQHGGSGQPVDWDLAAEIVLSSPIPVILAGGLTPENVTEAIRRVQPAGVDVSSGIEKAPGIKDSERLRSFIENAKA
jgi:phosphoribosylanthranilate isomerase